MCRGLKITSNLHENLAGARPGSSNHMEHSQRCGSLIRVSRVLQENPQSRAGVAFPDTRICIWSEVPGESSHELGEGKEAGSFTYLRGQPLQVGVLGQLEGRAHTRQIPSSAFRSTAPNLADGDKVALGKTLCLPSAPWDTQSQQRPGHVSSTHPDSLGSRRPPHSCTEVPGPRSQ